ncbi:unnamed protein product [Dibothriocephalus latus]|uniref:Nucleolar protein 4 helical domain-containing protein n=1 Tax=Dibothriocephalus latus TaxID=60516 RepID=A0A3P7LCX4_DIBLA|nr:unnamed protein product [Dibothriocephalus latus]
MVDETLDRTITFCEQPRHAISALERICAKAWPQLESKRHRNRIRAYLKACRRNSKKNRGQINMKEPPLNGLSAEARQMVVSALNLVTKDIEQLRQTLMFPTNGNGTSGEGGAADSTPYQNPVLTPHGNAKSSSFEFARSGLDCHEKRTAVPDFSKSAYRLRVDGKQGPLKLPSLSETPRQDISAPPAHFAAAKYSPTLNEATARLLDVRPLTQDDISYFQHYQDVTQDALEYIKGVSQMLLKKAEVLEGHFKSTKASLSHLPLNFSNNI